LTLLQPQLCSQQCCRRTAASVALRRHLRSMALSPCASSAVKLCLLQSLWTSHHR
jgi:hypothetical protein